LVARTGGLGGERVPRALVSILGKPKDGSILRGFRVILSYKACVEESVKISCGISTGQTTNPVR
jgi:hypothetical protein